MPLPLEIADQPEERVLRQLVSALVFECVATLSEDEADGRTLLSFGSARVRCLMRRGPFGRPRIVPGTIEQPLASGLGWQAASLETVLSGLGLPAKALETLLSELQATIGFLHQDSTFAIPSDRRHLAFDRLDGVLSEAHPYHPCFKSRSGFSAADNAAFGPEAGQVFKLHWLAVARTHLREALPGDSLAFWMAELGQPVVEVLDACLTGAGISLDSHGLVPVHPWQWQRLKDDGLALLLSDGAVVHLGEHGPLYRATQSIRTLANADNPDGPHVKLPLDIVNTSAMRILEPHSITTAPHLSAWLARVIDGDPTFETRYPLAILQEYAGLRVDAHGPLDGRLGMMLRESPARHLRDGEQAVPFNALMMLEGDGAPFIHPWVASHGLGAWLQRLIEVTVLPVWHLLVDHGIALEAHGQNMILVLRDGWPERLVLRDFHESVEYCPALLKEPGLLPDFTALDPVYVGAASDAYYWTDHPNELRELVMDCLFIYCLSEVSLLIETAYGFAEDDFWSLVSQVLDSYGASYPDKARLALLAHDRPEISTESLLSRKLFRDRTDFRHRVPNPISRVERSVSR